MRQLKIQVENKKAVLIEPAHIVCDNSDYLIEFFFDSDWDKYPYKTARFTYNGKYEDVIFEGNICNAPPIHKATGVFVGVYAGDISTTSAALVPCVPSILTLGGEHADPPEDVYNQLMHLINRLLEEHIAPTEEFDNYSEVINYLNRLDKGVYNVGQRFAVKTPNVLGLLIVDRVEQATPYHYTSDEAFISTLNNETTVTVGYFVLSAFAVVEYAKAEELEAEEARATAAEQANAQNIRALYDMYDKSPITYSMSDKAGESFWIDPDRQAFLITSDILTQDMINAHCVLTAYMDGSEEAIENPRVEVNDWGLLISAKSKFHGHGKVEVLVVTDYTLLPSFPYGNEHNYICDRNGLYFVHDYYTKIGINTLTTANLKFKEAYIDIDRYDLVTKNDFADYDPISGIMTAGRVSYRDEFGIGAMADAVHPSTLRIVPASNHQIAQQTDGYNPIVPSTISYAVKEGLVNNKSGALTDAEKTKVLKWLGAQERFASLERVLEDLNHKPIEAHSVKVNENGKRLDVVLAELAAGGSDGLAYEAKSLLITILRNVSYVTDQTENINALEMSLGLPSGDDNVTIDNLLLSSDGYVLKDSTGVFLTSNGG